MNKIFKIIYFANVIIIVAALLTPIIELLIDNGSSDGLLLSYYAVSTILSITFCIVFFALNIFGALKYRAHRVRYYTIAFLSSVWIIWGTYQIVYGYLHDVSL